MPIVELPTPLVAHTAGRHRVEVAGATVGAVVAALEGRYPGLAGTLLDDRRRAPLPHVALFVDDEPAGLDRPLEPRDELHVVLAVAGGWSRRRGPRRGTV